MIYSSSPRPRRLLLFLAGLALSACAFGSSPHSTAASSSSVRPAGTVTPTAPSAVSSASASTSDPLPSASSTGPLPSGVLAEVPVTVGMAPSEMVAAGGSIWVEGHRGYVVDRIDPESDRVTAVVTTNQNGCGQPVALDGGVWIQPCGDSESTVVIDDRTATVRGVIKDAGGYNLAVGDGSVWEASYELSAVLRIDPTTLKVIARIPVDSGVIVFGGGMIWSVGVDVDSQNTTGKLTEINPRTDRIVSRFRIPTLHDAYGAFARGSIWLKSDDNSTLLRFDTRTHRSSKTHLAGWAALSSYTDQAIDVAAGSLWIRTSPKHVARIDPATSAVTATYSADKRSPGGSPLVAFGSVWESNFDSDTVWRDHRSG